MHSPPGLSSRSSSKDCGGAGQGEQSVRSAHSVFGRAARRFSAGPQLLDSRQEEQASKEKQDTGKYYSETMWPSPWLPHSQGLPGPAGACRGPAEALPGPCRGPAGALPPSHLKDVQAGLVHGAHHGALQAG